MDSLNDAIALILARHSTEARDNWLHFSPITQPITFQQDIVRVNHFLRIQLGLLDIDTTEARECLTNEEDWNAWLDGFEVMIAPIIVRHGLPIWHV
tara:strand:- start:4057 stop:4344 length:288 start_codon:yes stop_codon:yes gene_type:complete